MFVLLFSSGLSNRRIHKGKSGKHEEPVVFFMIAMFLAPIVFVVYGLQFIGGIIDFDL